MLAIFPKAHALEAAREDKELLSRAISKTENKLTKVKEDVEKNAHNTTSVTGQ